MHLERLEMIGFKSFMDKTALSFSKPITAIVGPNGCGKSNVVDAIRWVMGEQSPKHLRGAQMEDVIFNGSEREKPLGMASVELTFSSAAGGFPPPYGDYSEVSIARRLYRDGESEYLINRQAVRLRDIHDFLAGTGLGKTHYAIVEQGRVGQLISAKPEDRRSFIEEAAGISRFKARKDAALRKMAISETNVTRLNDILSELESRMGSLERQVSKAERFEALSRELKESDLRLLSSRFVRLSERLDTASRSRQHLETESGDLDSALAAREASIAEVQLEHAESAARFQELQEKDYQLQNALSLLKTSDTYKVSERAERDTARERAAAEIELVRNKLAALKADCSTWQERETRDALDHGALKGDCDRAREILQTRSEDETRFGKNLETTKEALLRLEFARDHSGERTESLDLRLRDLSEKEAALSERLQKSADSRERLAHTVRGLQTELEDLKQLSLKLVEDRDSLRARSDTQRNALADLDIRLDKEETEFNRLNSRLESLRQIATQFEGYSQGVRFVMNTPGRSGLHGTLAQKIETDPEWESAVAAVLSNQVEAILCESKTDAATLISALKENTEGRAAFLPLDLSRDPKPSPSFSTPSDALGLLRERVRAPAEYQSMVDTLIGNALIAADLPAAFSLFEAIRARGDTPPLIATPSGDLLHPSGLVVGGSADDGARALLANEREQKELEGKCDVLRRSVQSLQAEQRALKEALSALDRELSTAIQTEHEEALKRVAIEKRLEGLSTEARYAETQANEWKTERERLDRERETVKTALSQHQSSQQDMTEKIDAARRLVDDTLKEFDRAREAREMAQRTLIEWDAKLDGAIRDAAQVKNETERLEREIAEQAALLEKREGEKTDCESRIRDIDTERERIQEEFLEKSASLGELKETLAALQTAYAEFTERLRQDELEVHKLRRQRSALSERLHALDLEMQEHRLTLSHYVEQGATEYGADLSQYAAHTDFSPIPKEEESAWEETIKTLRGKRDRLGPVNLEALAEYTDIKARFVFLSEQKRDLEASLTGLKAAIRKIDETSRARFGEAWTAVNQAFSELFPRLFRGGRAHLALTNPDDLLESGVEIMAQPPGKKLQAISLLSGGEQALTAMSLLFAIFSYRPSPFCILDEVDAPLDDQNVLRYNDIIKAMSIRSQFILVTHAKPTMEIAETLYGVTMPEAGVSKIVSVELAATQATEAAA